MEGYAARVHAVPQYQEVIIVKPETSDLIKPETPCIIFRFYEHQPLIEANEIRLLRLHPRKAWTTVGSGKTYMPKCELLTVNLDHHPIYTALSYAWGPLLEYLPVQIGDESCYAVTKTLHSFLETISIDEPLDLWVDQMCINQYNLAERNRQVRLMSRIFEQAAVTYVWLGPTDDSSEAAFKVLEDLGRRGMDLREAQRSYELVISAEETKDFLSRWNLDSQDWAEGLEGLLTLSERRWFQRLWTLQEVVLSRRVRFLCGEVACDQYALLRAFLVAGTWGHVNTPGISNTRLSFAFRERYWRGERDCLDDLLIKTSDADYRCTDPLDRVYAVLALQTQRLESKCDINVNYDRSLQSLYLEVAREAIRKTRSLKLLQRERSKLLEACPSWAPQWHVKSEAHPISLWRKGRPSRRGEYLHVWEDSEPHQLIIRGQIIATVVNAFDEHKFGDFGVEFSDGDLRTALGATTLIPAVVASLKQTYAQLLPDQYNDVARYLLAATFTCGKYRIDWDEITDWPESADVADIIDILQTRNIRDTQVCYKRKLATLDKYFLALVPESTEPGDSICVANGSSTPLVLRRSGEHHLVIGECYVDQIMDGEAVEWADGEGDRIILV